MNPDIFSERHIGPRGSQIQDMLSLIGVSSLDVLINETVPNNIRLQSPMKLDLPMSEPEYLEHIQALGNKNKVFKSFHISFTLKFTNFTIR